MDPTFSIVIPTKDRFDTFRSTFLSVASQATEECEIVVADNASSSNLREFVESFHKCKTSYLRSSTILSMTDNWIRGVEAARGSYITVLGDDDALMPDALQVARLIIDETRTPILSWNCHTYWWPNAILEHLRNLLFISYTNSIQYANRNPVSLLASLYRGEVGYADLPMLYNSFVHRDVLSDIREKWDSFFPVNHCPDVVSGIFNCLHSESIIHCVRPLAIRGNSGKSNGTAFYARSKGSSLRQEFMSSERLDLGSMIHPRLVPSPNVIIAVASAMLNCSDLLETKGYILPKMDIKSLVRSMVADLPRDPDSYDENLYDARALADKIGYNIDVSDVPPNPGSIRHVPRSGVSAVKPDAGTMNITIDGDVARFKDVYSASLVAASLIPGLQ